MWRKWLIDIPAAIVTIWWAAYTWLLTGMIMLAVTVMATMLVLYALGIRWGW